jgi:hypothetical protein
VFVALWLEIRPSNSVLHPFAEHPIRAGATITQSDVEFRSVPGGLLPAVSLPHVTDHPVEAGEPVLPPSSQPTIPEKWWAVELPSPSAVSPGSQVRVVITGFDQPTLSTIGIVVQPGDEFGEPTALVAVEELWADLVASAAKEGRVTLMVSS